jgi:hypothetical protein
VAQAPLVLEIGGVVLRITSSDARLRLRAPAAVARFARGPADRADLDVSASFGDLSADVPTGPLLFDSGSLWRLHDDGGRWTWRFTSPAYGAIPFKRATFDRDLSTGHVVLHRPYFGDEPIYPLDYPLDELVMINWLAHGRGVELHGCAVLDVDGRGYVFVGYSGAGKTTTARLWRDQPGVTVLTDDRVIVRVVDGRPTMFGTPWHGDEPLAASHQAPITRIFVLEHGDTNTTAPLDQASAVAALLARCFPPFHDREGMASTLEQLDSITRGVRVDRLRFVPTPEIVECVRGWTRT